MPLAMVASDLRPERDPKRIADLVLATAVGAGADAVFVEPSAGQYAITVERGTKVVATAALEAGLGAAVVARLGFVAELDVATPHAVSGVVPVRSGDREAHVVITLRPGADVRADLMVIRPKPRAAAPYGPIAGDVLGPYRVVEKLGAGGMGTVFRVDHVTLGRAFALKVLRPKVLERHPEAGERFLREARTAARVRHANIVDVVDFGHVPDGRPYLVMELLEGESLSARVARGALPHDDVMTVAHQLADALAAAHDSGIVHADVTPANVFVRGEGKDALLKLLDFGLAELIGEDLRDEPVDTVHGTPHYISPEQLRGQSPTDRSDQYSLGAVMFKLLCGFPPYEAPSLHDLCMMHLQAPIPELTSPHGPLPQRLVDVVTTCLQKHPTNRFPSTRALIAALSDIDHLVDRRGWRRWLSG